MNEIQTGGTQDWRTRPNAPESGTVIGPLTFFPEGGARMLEFGGAEGSKPFRLLVLRSGEEFFAYVNACAHFGVPLAASEEKLIHTPHQSVTCNVHYARYRWRDGICESGDCEGEALQAVPVALIDDRVVIA